MDSIEKRLNITSNHTLKTENIGGDRPIQAQGWCTGENGQYRKTAQYHFKSYLGENGQRPIQARKTYTAQYHIKPYLDTGTG